MILLYYFKINTHIAETVPLSGDMLTILESNAVLNLKSKKQPYTVQTDSIGKSK